MNRFVLIVMTTLLTACSGGEHSDLEEFIANAGKDLRGKVEPPPEIKPYEPFTYDNREGLPDPFKPKKPEASAGRGGGGLNAPDLDRPREALEEFPLDSLKMVGFWSQNGAASAVIRSSDGKLHRVRVGNYMGQNFGRITAVSETEVRILEVVQDSAGDWSERESTLQLIQQ